MDIAKSWLILIGENMQIKQRHGEQGAMDSTSHAKKPC